MSRTWECIKNKHEKHVRNVYILGCLRTFKANTKMFSRIKTIMLIQLLRSWSIDTPFILGTSQILTIDRWPSKNLSLFIWLYLELQEWDCLAKTVKQNLLHSWRGHFSSVRETFAGERKSVVDHGSCTSGKKYRNTEENRKRSKLKAFCCIYQSIKHFNYR